MLLPFRDTGYTQIQHRVHLLKWYSTVDVYFECKCKLQFCSRTFTLTLCTEVPLFNEDMSVLMGHFQVYANTVLHFRNEVPLLSER